MSNIELVIKIPEEAYKLLQNEGVDWLGAEHILDAVAKGKPLDKIRDEIEQKIIKRPYMDFKQCERWHNDAILEVLDIIDKYKAESEVYE